MGKPLPAAFSLQYIRKTPLGPGIEGPKRRKAPAPWAIIQLEKYFRIAGAVRKRGCQEAFSTDRREASFT